MHNGTHAPHQPQVVGPLDLGRDIAGAAEVFCAGLGFAGIAFIEESGGVFRVQSLAQTAKLLFTRSLLRKEIIALARHHELPYLLPFQQLLLVPICAGDTLLGAVIVGEERHWAR